MPFVFFSRTRNGKVFHFVLSFALLIWFASALQQPRPLKNLLKGRPVRLRVLQEVKQPVRTNVDDDDESSSSSPSLTSYMQLPAAQYACVPMPLNSFLRREYGTPDRFLLGVPPVRFRLPKIAEIEVAPEVQTVVDVLPDRVTITAESCRIVSPSEWVENLKLNERFELAARATLTWNDDDEDGNDLNDDDGNESADVIRCESEIEIDVWPPSRFRFVPRGILELAGNAAMNYVVGLLQEEFVSGLGKDFERWATDESYREERRKMEEELVLELQQPQTNDNDDT